jgi:hypothetical protein
MRNAILGLAILTAAVSTGAQQAPKLECRDLALTGNFINANETVVNGSACHVVEEPKPTASPAAQPVATAPVAAVPSAAPDAQANIYFYRAKRFQGYALKPSVYVDDARVGTMHNGDSIKVPVAPGEHRLYSNDKSTGIELDAKAGQTYYVRIDIQVGAWKGHGAVTLVDPQQGKYEVGQAAHSGGDEQ